MSADRLRQAATVLRERAEAATPGPWKWEDPSGYEWSVGEESLHSIATDPPETVLYGYGYDASGIDATQADRDYIAMMQPPVGLALADWLDDLADHGASDLMPMERGAFVIADLILGGTS